MVKRKQDGGATEPLAKRVSDNRKELDLAITKYVVEALKKKPNQQRLSLPCPTHHPHRCSCTKQRILINMYETSESHFGLLNKYTGLPFVPRGPEGDGELKKATADLFVKNPTLMAMENTCLVGIVEKVLLEQFDIINPGARAQGILYAAMETARTGIAEKPAAVTQQQHGELKDAMVAGFSEANGLFKTIGGITKQNAQHIGSLTSQVQQHGGQLRQHGRQLQEHERQLDQSISKVSSSSSPGCFDLQP